jgi:hypothetical protein
MKIQSRLTSLLTRTTTMNRTGLRTGRCSRMAETAAHLVEHVFPRVPVRQWVVTFPKRLRYFLHRDRVLLRSRVLRLAPTRTRVADITYPLPPRCRRRSRLTLALR